MKQRNIGLLLKQINLEYAKLMDSRLGKYNLSAAQGEALYYISLDEGLNQSKLRKQLGISAASLSTLIDSLASKQMVERRTDPADPRRSKLYLTRRAKPVAAEIAIIKQGIYTGLKQTMSEAQLAVLGEWLEQFLDNLKQQGASPKQ